MTAPAYNFGLLTISGECLLYVRLVTDTSIACGDERG